MKEMEVKSKARLAAKEDSKIERRKIAMPKNLQNVQSAVKQRVSAPPTAQGSRPSSSTFLRRSANQQAPLEQAPAQPYKRKHMKLKPTLDVQSSGHIEHRERNFVSGNKREALNPPRTATAAFDAERQDRLHGNTYVPAPRTIGKDMNKEYGKVPTYLKDRKQQEAVAAERQRQIDIQEANSGLVLMTEDQRAEILGVLGDKEQELQTALSKLPLAIQTLSMQRRKNAIEDEIVEIAKAMEKFSKKEVWISMDE
jgi:hypothetical protein